MLFWLLLYICTFVCTCVGKCRHMCQGMCMEVREQLFIFHPGGLPPSSPPSPTFHPHFVPPPNPLVLCFCLGKADLPCISTKHGISIRLWHCNKTKYVALYKAGQGDLVSGIGTQKLDSPCSYC